MTGPFEGLRTADVGGTRLAYREAGTGAPVLLVHGSASDLRTWEGQLRPIGERYRAIAYSRRFAPPNPDIPPGADDPMPPHAEDLLGLIDALDLAPAHVVGHSWGGFVALLAAIRSPRSVRSLVLMEPPTLPLFVSMPPKPSEMLRLLVRRPRTAAAILRFAAGAAVPAANAFRRGDTGAGIAAFGRGVLGPEAFDRLSPARRAQVRENVGTVRAQILGTGFPPLSDDAVRAVALPVLLLTGARSPALWARIADRLEELLPRVERHEIPDASHVMHEDNPEAVAEAILGFLDRRS